MSNVNVADIVYVGGDLTPSDPPRLDVYYRLAKQTSSNSTVDMPEHGAQLRRGKKHCGWIRKHDLTPIMHLLDEGCKIAALVKSLETFSWKNEQCFWGVVEWSVVT